MKPYSDQDRQQIESESEELRKFWLQHTNDQTNGNKNHQHFPPSIAFGVQAIANEFVQMCASAEGHVSMESLYLFGANLFALGQLSAVNGHTIDKLTPCNCTEISDAEIAKFISG